MLADPFLSLTGASGSRTDDPVFPFRLRQTITIIMTTAMATTIIVDTMIMIKYFVAKPPLPFVASVLGG